jgi:hypothetical protein
MYFKELYYGALLLLLYSSKTVPMGLGCCNVQYIISMIPKNNDQNLLFQFRQIVLYIFQRSTQHFQFVFSSAGFLNCIRSVVGLGKRYIFI